MSVYIFVFAAVWVWGCCKCAYQPSHRAGGGGLRHGLFFLLFLFFLKKSWGADFPWSCRLPTCLKVAGTQLPLWLRCQLPSQSWLCLKDSSQHLCKSVIMRHHCFLAGSWTARFLRQKYLLYRDRTPAIFFSELSMCWKHRTLTKYLSTSVSLVEKLFAQESYKSGKEESMANEKQHRTRSAWIFSLSTFSFEV